MGERPGIPVTGQIYFPPVRGEFAPTAAWLPQVFDAGELARIEASGNKLALEQAKTALGSVLLEKRNSRIAWLRNDAEWAWLFARMHYYAHLFNARYRFDLWGFTESFQFTEYGPGGHFDWHVDDGVPGAWPRKLSFTLQLSDPGSYEGGDLEIWGLEKISASRERGTLICFPSYMLHRVAPVTRGIRRSLVAWVTGEVFR